MRRMTMCFVALMICLIPLAAGAQAPAYLPVQGFLTDADDTPIDGETTLTFSLYSDPMTPTPLYSEVQVVLVEDGFFTAFLGQVDVLDLDLFQEGEPLYLGVAVDEAAELSPRLVLGSVPYAAFAQRAGDARTLGGMSAAEFRAAADGVSWEDLTDLPDGVADGDDDVLGGLSCSDGQVAMYDSTGGAWICGDSGGGLSTEAELTALLDDNYLPMSYLPDWAELQNVPPGFDDGVDDDTQYGAQSPLVLTAGNEFGLGVGAVTGAYLSNAAVTNSKIAVGAVDSSSIANGTISYADVDTDSLQRRVAGNCAAGSSIRAINQDGTVTCEADDDTDTDTAAPGTSFVIGGGTAWSSPSGEARSNGATTYFNNSTIGTEFYSHALPIPTTFAGRPVIIDSVTVTYSCTASYSIQETIVGDHSGGFAHTPLASDYSAHTGDGSYTVEVNKDFVTAAVLVLAVQATSFPGDCAVLWSAEYHY